MDVRAESAVRGGGGRGLLGIGFLYFIGQLLLVSPQRAVSWDEAIYLSQVTRGATALTFAPSRARGITVLVLPVARFATSTVAVRVWLAAASSLVLVYAFRTWRPLLGHAATLGAAVFAGTWLALLYGSEVMPNLWAALLAVAATGYAARFAWGGRARIDLVSASVFLALMALFRPPDAAILSLVLASVLAVRGVDTRAVAVWMPIGAAVGWVPWLVEMQVRFGLGTGLRDAASVSHVSTGGLATRLFQHLGLTDGPTIGPVPGAPIPPPGAIWWAFLLALTAVAIGGARQGEERGPVLLASIAGSVMAAEYLLLVSGLAPRFLLPAYALLSLSAAAGLRGLLAAGRRRAGVVAAGTAVLLLVWQAGVALRVGNEVEAARASDRDVGLAVRAAAGGRDCALMASDSYPQIGFAAGCLARSTDGRTSPAWLDSYAARGYAVFLVTGEVPEASAFTQEFPAPLGWHILAPDRPP